jgi:A/G-specific adenine glycosylase
MLDLDREGGHRLLDSRLGIISSLSSPSVKPKSIPHPLRRQRFKRRLLAWFRREGRDLPWRRTRDPYRILVSEMMLQQTQVSRVEGFWHRFLGRFPSLADLAAARPAEVREAWDGLGYYRRASNLHALARTVVREHDGELPDTAAGLRALPGVGPYTAGAVACFAYELPEPAVDTNVARVLRRVFHPRTAPGAGLTRKLAGVARQLLRRRGRDSWITNQALMELGALVCTARVRRCEACPVTVVCLTYAADQRRVVAATKSTVRSRSRGRT